MAEYVEWIEIMSDLIEVIGYYATPAISTELVTMTRDLVRRNGYSELFWKRKVLVNQQGLVPEEVAIHESPYANPWYVWYRLTNRLDYGVILGVATNTGSRFAKADPVVSLHALEKGEFAATTPNGDVIKYNKKHTKSIILRRTSHGLVTKVEPKGRGHYYFLTERGAVLEVKQGSIERVFQTSGAVDINGFSLEVRVLQRDGTAGWYLTAFPGFSISANPPGLRVVAFGKGRIYSDLSSSAVYDYDDRRKNIYGAVISYVSPEWSDAVVGVTVGGRFVSQLIAPNLILSPEYPALRVCQEKSSPDDTRSFIVLTADGKTSRYHEGSRVLYPYEITGVKSMVESGGVCIFLR